MTVHGILADGARKLNKIYPKQPNQAWFEAELLIGHALKRERSWLVSHADQTLTGAQKRTVDSLIKRRLTHEPLAYLLGHWHFCGREFLVDRHTLIPRPETEELVARARSIIRKHDLVWDVGTGSGAIAITLAREANALVIASDVNSRVLNVAKKNARRQKAAVKFFRSDLLGPSVKKILKRSHAVRFIVVANLPYLPLSDRRKLSPEVTKFEPESALFTKDDGMFLIKKLLTQLAAFQARDRRSLMILAEIDPPQAKTLARFAANVFPSSDIQVISDQYGRKRVLSVLIS